MLIFFLFSIAKKKRNNLEPCRETAQEELLDLEREKVQLMREQLATEKERLKLEMAKSEFLKEHCRRQEARGSGNFELLEM